MDVVLAVDENGKILGKPSTIPEGKMDININETCDFDHTPEVTLPLYEDDLPIGDWDNGDFGNNNGNTDSNNNGTGNDSSGNNDYDDTIPGEDVWQNENFGIN
jgi:penicillin-binding protein 1A